MGRKKTLMLFPRWSLAGENTLCYKLNNLWTAVKVSTICGGPEIKLLPPANLRGWRADARSPASGRITVVGMSNGIYDG